MHEKLQLCDKRRERKRESVCEREITGAGIFCCVCGRERGRERVCVRGIICTGTCCCVCMGGGRARE